jgi:DNA-binding IclR family transcriptional regulator
MKLTGNQITVLSAVIEHSLENQCPPVLGQITELSGMPAASVSRALRRLQLGGYVRQDGKFAAYLPLKNADGHMVSTIIKEIK